MYRVGLDRETLSRKDLQELEAAWRRCAANIIYMTTTAGSGHPGGSLSLLQILLLLFSMLKYDPKNPHAPERDRVIVSNGHISPGVYSVLGEAGFFDAEDAVAGFRKAGSIFGGHVESTVPGVEWSSGNLGQGLSAACASAWAEKMKSADYWTVAVMGDGEQQKGQISEARRFAAKYNLSRLVGIVDLNHLQIGGDTSKIMPQDISAEFASDGWNVIYLDDGNDFTKAHAALRKAFTGQVEDRQAPTVIIAENVMGKGVSFMENDAHYHGAAASEEQARQALAEIGVENRLDYYKKLRAETEHSSTEEIDWDISLNIDPGQPTTYPMGEKLDNRSAYGNTLADLGRLNNTVEGRTKVLGLTCDLEESVRMGKFKQTCPDYFIEDGIQEHHTAAMAGRLSVEGFQPFFSTFGVFGADEVYNQQRLNAFNRANLKVVCTHCGLDVGEDGPTHQSVDYIGLLKNAFGFKIIVPADPNQTDRVIRHIATQRGNYFVALGRSKMDIIAGSGGQPFFGGGYTFEEGRADWIMNGKDGAIVAIGPMVPVAIDAAAQLRERGKEVAVINMASLVPIDRGAVIDAAKTGSIVTIEDHSIHSGLGSLVANVLAEEGISVKFRKLGVTRFGSSGKPAELYRDMGLTAEALLEIFAG